MTRDNLYHHYRTYYVPGNAVMGVAGDFKAKEMLGRIKELFGKILRRDSALAGKA